MAPNEPKDRHFAVLSIVCLLGVASLLPWNVLITQAQYLIVRAHVGSSPSGNWWADQIESLTANFYLFFNLAAFLVLLPLGKHVSIHKQISLPLCVSAIVVLLQAYIAFDVRLSGAFFIGSTLVSTALLGAATAPMTSATYALASFLPPLYIQALVLGQSLAGVATSVLSLATIWSSAVSMHELPDAGDVSKPATLYFLACGLVVILGIIGYWLLPHLHFVQHWTLKDATDDKAFEQQILAGPEDGDSVQFAPLSERSESDMQTAISSMVYKSRARETRQLLSRPSAQAMQAPETPGADITLWELSRRLKGYDAIVGLAFLVSLAAFPGLVACICSIRNGAKIAPCHSHPTAGRFYGDLFQLFIFLLFNAGDAAGRALAGLHKQPVQPPTLFAYAGLRILIVVGLAVCNVVPSRPWKLPAFLWSDFWPAALSGLLGLTNGHLATIALIHAPKLVPSKLRDRTGTLLSFSLTLGLTIGSFLSVGILSVLQSRPSR